MAYWNHFAEEKYKEVKWSDIPIGGKFRKDFFKGKRRSDIICVKTGELTYYEQRSKKERSFAFVDETTTVRSYDELRVGKEGKEVEK